LARHWSVCL